jgi:dihydrofolate reductase
MRLIAAVANNGVIGNNGGLPWRIPEELAFFNRMTKHGTLIVGRETAKSVPHRKAVVVSSKSVDSESHIYVDSIEDAVEVAKSFHTDIWVAGGSQIYSALIDKCETLYISHIKGDYKGDTFFPPFSKEFYLRDEIIYHPEFTTVKYVKPDFKRHYSEESKVIIFSLQGVYKSSKVKDIHAEKALYDAEPDVREIHMNALPCDSCAKLLVRLPLLNKITVHHLPNMGVSDGWSHKQEWAKIYLKQNGINIYELHHPA